MIKFFFFLIQNFETFKLFSFLVIYLINIFPNSCFSVERAMRYQVEIEKMLQFNMSFFTTPFYLFDFKVSEAAFFQIELLSIISFNNLVPASFFEASLLRKQSFFKFDQIFLFFTINRLFNNFNNL